MVTETVRLSQQAKQQLTKVKRLTGIDQWNVLCRWALCLSLRDPGVPAPAKIVADSNVEMAWKVFGGSHAEVYAAIVRERCAIDGLGDDSETVAQQFRLHLHRGIAKMSGDRGLRSVRDMLRHLPPTS